jgi:uncharacterized protein involved in exopolysaccharide biosynthesis
MEEEIELRDYINVLLKWKWLIVWITIVSIAATGVYSYFIAKPVYEGSALLQLPVINNTSIYNTSTIQSILKNEYFSTIISEEVNLPFQEVLNGISVSTISKSNDTIKINFENQHIAAISNFFDVLIPSLNSACGNKYSELISTLKNNLLNLQKELTGLTEKSNNISEKMAIIFNSKNVTEENLLEMSLLSNAYATISKQILELKSQITILENQLNASHDFQYIGKPFISKTPVKPKKLFNIAVAGVAAFFFAILLAFFLEYWYSTGVEDKNGKELKA